MWPRTDRRSLQAFTGTPNNTGEPTRSGKEKPPTENGCGFVIGGGEAIGIQPR